jgi:hypothetical protein
MGPLFSKKGPFFNFVISYSFHTGECGKHES